jgi:hypothetical protein
LLLRPQIPIVLVPFRIWCNDNWQGKLKCSEGTSPCATLSTTNPRRNRRLTTWATALPQLPVNVMFSTNHHAKSRNYIPLQSIVIYAHENKATQNLHWSICLMVITTGANLYGNRSETCLQICVNDLFYVSAITFVATVGNIEVILQFGNYARKWLFKFYHDCFIDLSDVTMWDEALRGKEGS